VALSSGLDLHVSRAEVLELFAGVDTEGGGDGLLSLDEFEAAFNVGVGRQKTSQLPTLEATATLRRQYGVADETRRPLITRFPKSVLDTYRLVLKEEAGDGTHCLWDSQGWASQHGTSAWAPRSGRSSISLGNFLQQSNSSPYSVVGVRGKVLQLEPVPRGWFQAVSTLTQEEEDSILEQICPFPKDWRMLCEQPAENPSKRLCVWEGVPPTQDFEMLGHCITLHCDPNGGLSVPLAPQPGPTTPRCVPRLLGLGRPSDCHKRREQHRIWSCCDLALFENDLGLLVVGKSGSGPSGPDPHGEMQPAVLFDILRANPAL